MGEPNDRDSDQMTALKQQLAAAAPNSPEDATANGMGPHRDILAQMDAERSRQDTAANEARNAEAAAAQQAWVSRLRSDGGGAK